MQPRHRLRPHEQHRPLRDANACTTADTCLAGSCVGGPAPNCDDSNPCTDDTCNPATGCVHTNNTAPCSDGNACTTADTCLAGSCVGGPAPNCDDSNPCTDDTCNPATGCVHTNNTAPCSDGNACTTADTCLAGSCVGGPAPNCDDSNPCTDDTCNPATGCVHTNNTAPCSDGSACTTAMPAPAALCVGGPALNCDDSNPCTDDSCNPATGCVHTNNTAPCSDGNACTTADTCLAGSCVGGPAPNCDDSNPCTDDTCNPATGCVHTNNTAPCSDGNACTTADTCLAGSCVGGPAPNCDDSNPCTDDTCNPATGCVHTNNTAPCSDGNACTTADTCLGGSCVGGPALNCDDSNVCTDDSCNPATGCVHTNNSVPCSDGSACTTADTCLGGSCVGGPALNCDDSNVCTDDSCNPATGCVHTNNSVPCSDGSACTTADTCSGWLVRRRPGPELRRFECLHRRFLQPRHRLRPHEQHRPLQRRQRLHHQRRLLRRPLRRRPGPELRRFESLHRRFLQPRHRLRPHEQHRPLQRRQRLHHGGHLPGWLCVGGPAPNCDDSNPCTDDSCNPATGCVHTNNTAPCNDGNACTTSDTCSGGLCVGGPAPNCDDSNPCTDDSCNPATGCVHTNNTAPCSDGSACTTNDACSGGLCVGGPAPNCDDSNPCTDDTCNPATGCVHTNNTAPCSDGNACTTADTCSGVALRRRPGPELRRFESLHG